MAHYPPYTSKYNPIEHRLFCHITSACKGTVFSSIDVVKSLVDKTSTSKGLKVFSTIKDKVYATARKVSETFKKNISNFGLVHELLINSERASISPVVEENVESFLCIRFSITTPTTHALEKKTKRRDKFLCS